MTQKPGTVRYYIYVGWGLAGVALGVWSLLLDGLAVVALFAGEYTKTIACSVLALVLSWQAKQAVGVFRRVAEADQLAPDQKEYHPVCAVRIGLN